MMDELLKRRRSVRIFNKNIPPKESIYKLIEAAISAPSANNKQPWKFIIIYNHSEIIKELQYIADMEIQSLSNNIHPDFRKQFRNYSKKYISFLDSRVMIIALYKINPTMNNIMDHDKKQTPGLNFIDHHNSLLSTGMAIENILLTATDLQLGACCITGHLIAKEKLKNRLKIPEGWEIAAFIPVGFPDEKPDIPKKKDIHTFIKWLEVI